MIEIQYSGTTLLLLVNPHIRTTSKQWHCAPQLYQSFSEKKTFIASYVPPVTQINNCLKITSAIKVAAMKIMDNFHYKWKPSHACHKIKNFCDQR